MFSTRYSQGNELVATRNLGKSYYGMLRISWFADELIDRNANVSNLNILTRFDFIFSYYSLANIINGTLYN